MILPAALRRTGLALAAIALGGCAAAAQQQPPATVPLLAPARIAALPAGERAAWERYLERSRAGRARDREALAAEARAAGRERAVPARVHAGFFLDELEPPVTAAWLAGAEAAALADAIVSFQTPAGGWSKRLSFARPRQPGEAWTSEGNSGWLGTLDNGGTTEQLRFLGRIAAARPEPRWQASFERGLEYLLEAQFPNGCWPQVYPLVGAYHDAATFNDDAIAHVLQVLRDVAGGEPAFVAPALRARARAALERGVDCVLAAQVVVAGRPAIWGQQHDPLTLAPVSARAYEHRSLASKESAVIAELLMALDSPSPAVRRAVRGAVAWFRENARYGFDYETKGGRQPRPGAGPLWPRFAEIGTNRPIFSNRDGVVLYEFERLDQERRTGYGWYTEEPAGTLKRYRTWPAASTTGPATAPRAGRAVVVDARSPAADGAVVAGVPTFRTIGAALAAAPPEDGRAYVIRVRPGRYYEKLHVERADVHLVGAGRDSTLLTYDAAAGAPAPGGAPWGTRGTATLRVAAPGFRLERMTVENGFDYPANYARPADDPNRLRDAQAVAVMLDEGSDRAVFRECRIGGHQDTLFPDAGRSWFHRCEISGSVDFIFGAGRALFEETVIVSRDRGSRGNNGYIAAPSTPAAQRYGLIFRACRLEKEHPGLAPGTVSLGRPWHPAGDPRVAPQAVFIDCWLDDHIAPAGWTFMNSTDALGVVTRHEPADARFFEYGSQGPGARSGAARRILPASELGRYDVAAVLDGWDPRD